MRNLSLSLSPLILIPNAKRELALSNNTRKKAVPNASLKTRINITLYGYIPTFSKEVKDVWKCTRDSSRYIHRILVYLCSVTHWRQTLLNTYNTYSLISNICACRCFSYVHVCDTLISIRDCELVLVHTYLRPLFFLFYTSAKFLTLPWAKDRLWFVQRIYVDFYDIIPECMNKWNGYF